MVGTEVTFVMVDGEGDFGDRGARSQAASRPESDITGKGPLHDQRIDPELIPEQAHVDDLPQRL